VTTPLKGDAVVLLNETFEPHPQAARETVALMKAMSMTPAEQETRARLRASLVAFSIRASTADVARIVELCERLSPPEPLEPHTTLEHARALAEAVAMTVSAAPLARAAIEGTPPADHFASPTERPT